MAITLNQVLEQVRRDLGDTDPVNARWSNDDLRRHIQHALEELSVAIPREVKTTLITTANSRDLDVSSLADRITVVAVEYPTGNYPPTYVRFSQWENTLTLLIDGAPSGGQNVNLYWHALHSLDQGGSTVPQWAEHLLPVGASGYAALEWASQAVNRINVGGFQVVQHYQGLASTQLARFREELKRLGARGSLRTAQLYIPSAPKPSQSTDPGP